MLRKPWYMYAHLWIFSTTGFVELLKWERNGFAGVMWTGVRFQLIVKKLEEESIHVCCA